MRFRPVVSTAFLALIILSTLPPMTAQVLSASQAEAPPPAPDVTEAPPSSLGPGEETQRTMKRKR